MLENRKALRRPFKVAKFKTVLRQHFHISPIIVIVLFFCSSYFHLHYNFLFARHLSEYCRRLSVSSIYSAKNVFNNLALSFNLLKFLYSGDQTFFGVKICPFFTNGFYLCVAKEKKSERMKKRFTFFGTLYVLVC